MIDVSAVMFRAAMECQSSEETRYYLCGVLVQPHPEKGALLVATDGHRLFVAHDEDGKCDKATIVALDKSAFPNKKAESCSRDARVKLDADGIVTVGTYRSLASCVIDGTYLDWANVIAPIVKRCKKGVRATAAYNPNYIGSFGKMAALLRGENHTSIYVVSSAPMEPSLVRFSGVDNAFGVLMPMRSDIIDLVPAFMKAVTDKSVVARPVKAPVKGRRPLPNKKAA